MTTSYVMKNRGEEKAPRGSGNREISFDNIARKKILDNISKTQLFETAECREVEECIDQMAIDADAGKFKKQTVDRAPLRTKYFFGEGYSYGGQLKIKGPGQERLYPKGEVDPIPSWIKKLVIRPIEKAGLIPQDWANSAVVNDYLPGGCIVSHIDPPQLFDRPIITASFHSDSALSFGCKFSFKPIQVSPPVARVPVSRGCVLCMGPGYSTDEVTHCIRPEDVSERRTVVILRHVPDTAPRMTCKELEEVRRVEELKKERKRRVSGDRWGGRPRRRSWSRRRGRSRSRGRREFRSRERRYSRSRSRRRVSRSRSGNRLSSRSREWRDQAHKSRSTETIHSSRKRSLEERLQKSRRPKEQSPASSSDSRDSSTGPQNRLVLPPKTDMKPSIPGFVPEISSSKCEEKEEGELSCDEKVVKTVTEIMQATTVDKEEVAFQKRLEKLKAKLSNKIEGNAEIQDNDNPVVENNNIKSVENKADLEDDTDAEHPGLKSEVNELRKELRELKEVINNLTNNTVEDGENYSNSDQSDDTESEEDNHKALNAVDIISREVRTTIMSKTETKRTKATYLKIKAERKEKLLKSKLIELKKKKSSISEFKKSTKTQRYRKTHSKSKSTSQSKNLDSETDDDGNNLLEALKRKLEKKIRDNLYQKSKEENKSIKILSRESRDKHRYEDRRESQKKKHSRYRSRSVVRSK